MGRGSRCRCPVHGGRSLILHEGLNGRLLLKCCDTREVLVEIRRRRLVGRHDGRGDFRGHLIARCRDDSVHLGNHYSQKFVKALAIWREARSATGLYKYLEACGIAFRRMPAEACAKLRYHPNCPHPNGARFSAMVALVEHVDYGPTAIHRTFLKPDGSGKAEIEPNKASLGPVKGGAVRLDVVRPDSWLCTVSGQRTLRNSVSASASVMRNT